MSCTPIPTGLKIVEHLIVCDSDWRVWEAPDFEPLTLVYDEVSGCVLADGQVCDRVFPPE
jgi:hypothetical protein